MRTFQTQYKLEQCIKASGLADEFYLVMVDPETNKYTAIFDAARIDKACNTTVDHVEDCGFIVLGKSK